MKILIIGGFLGSGKTTLLLQLAKYIVDTVESDSATKIAIVENEVGEVGVDNQTLMAGGYQVENLFAGCACCTMSGELPYVIQKIKEDLNPEWMVIESTGLAYPAKILETIGASLGLEGRICTVVDAKRWKRMLIPMQTFLHEQLEGAQTVLINKIDLVDDETLEDVKKSVEGFNPDSELIPLCGNEQVDESIWQKVLGI